MVHPTDSKGGSDAEFKANSVLMFMVYRGTLYKCDINHCVVASILLRTNICVSKSKLQHGCNNQANDATTWRRCCCYIIGSWNSRADAGCSIRYDGRTCTSKFKSQLS